MQITKLSESFSTGSQINVGDILEIAKLGFKTIINNRPDHEGGESQPKSAQLRLAAEQHGLNYIYMPVIANYTLAAQVDAFSTLFAIAEKPVLGFCRTGSRAGSIYRSAKVEIAITPTIAIKQ